MTVHVTNLTVHVTNLTVHETKLTPGSASPKLRALEFKQGFTAAVNAVHDWTNSIGSCSRELKASTRMGRV
jgi:hypothetical protein